MAGDKIRQTTDQRKSLASSEHKAFDTLRVAAQRSERLTLNPSREFLKGGTRPGETSKQQEITRQQSMQQEILWQRDGKTSSHAEIRLGSDRQRYPLRGGTPQHAQDYYNSLNSSQQQELKNFEKALQNSTVALGHEKRAITPQDTAKYSAMLTELFPEGAQLYSKYTEQLHRKPDEGSSSRRR